MSRYRRSLIPGGTYFFTVALANRQSTLLVDEVLHFKRAYSKRRVGKACVPTLFLYALTKKDQIVLGKRNCGN